MPEPPLRLRWPTNRTTPGRPVLTVDDVAVTGRLAPVSDLAIEGGDRLVVTGANGAGKSTLLAVLAGRLAPTRGRIHVHPTAQVSLLSQEVPDWPPELTAHEVFERHVGRLEVGQGPGRGRAVSPSGAGLLDSRSMRTPVARLSQGQQRRLHLALCLAEEPDLLLLDEPTNHLSATLVDELTEALQQTASAVVVATHDRQMLRDLADWPRLELAPL